MNTIRYAPAIAKDVAVAVLAAGSASRFGGGKLDAQLRGKPLGRWIIDNVEATGASSRILVVSDHPPAITASLCGWTVVENHDAGRGIGTSIRAAVQAAHGSRRLVIVLADMPFVTPEHLTRLSRGERATFTRHADGRPGVPAAFPASCFPNLLSLPPNHGAAHLSMSLVVDVIGPADASIGEDVDTAADIQRLEGQYPG